MTRPQTPGLSAFGQTAGGLRVDRITLRDDRMSVSLLTYGATLQGLWLDRLPHSLTLGMDDLRSYAAADTYPGAMVGPVANRIAGATALIADQPCRFDANEAGRTTLHGGRIGLHNQIWQLADLTETAATLTLQLPDGQGGFPGNRRLTARFSLPGDATLRLELTGTTDAPTALAPANHSYWNLDGTPDWTGHRLQIAADHWLPVKAGLIPTGQLAAATGAMDFRQPRALRPGTPALDHNFCLSPGTRALTHAATLTAASGLALHLSTTEPGLQVYDGRGLIRPGDVPYAGLALEAQRWPDALHHPGFPSVIATPERPYSQTTEWRFVCG
ncbi:MAG: aldose epimerase family protein [Paracoccaceae bacterium]